MPGDRPLISISIVSHGDAAPLRLLLDSLSRFASGRDLQLVITDNLGGDLPDLDPSPWHSLALLRNDRPAGFASNHNAAFTKCTGEYFCVLNPDVQFIQPVLAGLTDSLRAGQGAIVAPLIVDSLGAVQDSFRGLPSPLEIIGRRLLPEKAAPVIPSGKQVFHVDWLAGIFLLCHHDTFARLSGFDPRYRLYFEDVDLCTRARLLGLSSIVNPQLQVRHDAKRSSRQPGRYLLWHLQSSLRFFTSSVYWQARRAALSSRVA